MYREADKSRWGLPFSYIVIILILILLIINIIIIIRIPSGGAHPEAQAQMVCFSCDRAFVMHASAPLLCFIHYRLLVHLLLPHLLLLFDLSC